MGAHLSADEQKKEYIKVFKWLCILTVIEVAAVYLEKLHVPKIIVTLIIVFFSCMKAVLVGYYYMHLKYEARWLKIVALLPIIAFAYALVLGADYKIFIKDHAPSTYIPDPPRVVKEAHDEDLVEEPIVLKLDEAQVNSAPAKEAAPEKPNEGATEAPAAGGGGDWN